MTAREGLLSWLAGLSACDLVAVESAGADPRVERVARVTRSLVVVGPSEERYCRVGDRAGKHYLRRSGRSIRRPTPDEAERVRLVEWLRDVEEGTWRATGAATLAQLRAMRLAHAAAGNLAPSASVTSASLLAEVDGRVTHETAGLLDRDDDERGASSWLVTPVRHPGAEPGAGVTVSARSPAAAARAGLDALGAPASHVREFRLVVRGAGPTTVWRLEGEDLVGTGEHPSDVLVGEVGP